MTRFVGLFGAWSALAVAAAVGCSTFSDADTAPSVNDGGGAEGSASDAGGSDAANEAANDAGNTPHFCALQSPAPTFCDDFDESAPLSQKWSLTYTTDGGTIGVDTTPDAATSAPGSLLATLGPLADGVTGEASVRRALPNGTSDVDLSFMMRAESLDSALVVVSIRIGTSTAFYQADLTLQSGTQATFEEYAVPGFADASTFYDAHYFATPDYLGSFTYVRIHMTYGANPHAKFFFGSPTTAVIDADFTPTTTNGNIDVAIGTVYTTGPSGGAKVRFDDVVIHTK